MNNERYTDLQTWVNDQMLRGSSYFTREEIQALHLPIMEQSINRSLSRMIRRGTIMSPWQNFYVIVPIEYRLKRNVPPTFYMDQLMRFLGRKYYFALLTGAAFNGASHQRAMVEQIMVDGAAIVRSKVIQGIKVEFTRKQNLLLDYCKQLKSQTGYIYVSGPELTALDVVDQYTKVGGISRAAELLVELCEQTRWNDNVQKLVQHYSAATIQRLGYLLEYIEETKQSNRVYKLAMDCGKVFRKIPLRQNVKITDDMEVHPRWKIIQNYELDIDDI